jgi:hypothetical protein
MVDGSGGFRLPRKSLKSRPGLDKVVADGALRSHFGRIRLAASDRIDLLSPGVAK